MKLKDKILKDFREKFLISGDFLIRAYPYDVKEFLFKALDSMREETLREVELQSKIVKPHSSDTLEQIQNNFIQIGYNRAVIDLEDFINNLKTKNEQK